MAELVTQHNNLQAEASPKNKRVFRFCCLVFHFALLSWLVDRLLILKQKTFMRKKNLALIKKALIYECFLMLRRAGVTSWLAHKFFRTVHQTEAPTLRQIAVAS